MQGKKYDREKLFTSFRLSSRIPKDNFYRRLKEMLDLSFLYEHTKDLYGTTGHPSIDPVVFRTGGPVQIHAHRALGKHYLCQKAG